MRAVPGMLAGEEIPHERFGLGGLEPVSRADRRVAGLAGELLEGRGVESEWSAGAFALRCFESALDQALQARAKLVGAPGSGNGAEQQAVLAEDLAFEAELLERR